MPEDGDTLEDDDIITEDVIFRCCSSLVRHSSNNEGVEFAHFTVQEFLSVICPSHADLSAYSIPKEYSDHSAKVFRTQLFLKYLNLKNFDHQLELNIDPMDRQEERARLRPLYRYAAVAWQQDMGLWTHAPEETREARAALVTNETVWESMKELFHATKTALFCSWCLEYFLDLVYRNPNLRPNISAVVSGILRPDFTPLHMASSLGIFEVCEHLISQGADLNQRSVFGTPLHCSISRKSIFFR